MQAVVRTHHIKIEISGEIHPELLNLLNKLYPDNIQLSDDDEYVKATETDWYKKAKARMMPGKVMMIYRENKGWTQQDLSKKIGVSIQNISHYENDRRPISHKLAYQLSNIFEVPIKRFLKEE